jgi:alpha-glucosidase (family GH31 glycosyl hydrolase)
MPLEGIWLDIPYMNKYYDFTVDTTKFPTLKELTDTCHANGQRVIPIIDAGISSNDTQNKYFAAAAASDSLLRSTAFPEEQFGFLSQHVWPFENKDTIPAHTVYLDFFKQEAKDVWASGIKDLHALFPFDGIWLDMNEATGFCNGECPDGLVPDYNNNTQKEEKNWF